MKHLKTVIIIFISTLLFSLVSTHQLDAAGKLNWKRVFDEYNFTSYNIKSTKSGYIICGRIEGDAYDDLLVLYINKQGDLIWEKEVNFPKSEGATSAVETAQGFLIAGFTSSKGYRARDAWLIHLSNKGRVLWERMYGTYRDDYATSIKSIKNGFIVFGTMNRKKWLARLSADGKTVWDIWEIKNKQHTRRTVVRRPKQQSLPESYRMTHMDVNQDTILIGGEPVYNYFYKRNRKDHKKHILIQAYSLNSKQLWEKKLTFSTLYSLKKINNGFLLVCGNKQMNNNDTYFIFIDAKGQVTRKQKINYKGFPFDVIITRKNSIITGYFSYRQQQTRLEFMTYSSHGTFIKKSVKKVSGQLHDLTCIESPHGLLISGTTGKDNSLTIISSPFTSRKISYKTSFKDKVVTLKKLNKSIKDGNRKLFRKLLKKDAPIHDTDETGRTPLLNTAIYNRPYMTQALIDKGVDIHTSDRYGATPLFLAVNKGSTRIAKILIKNGADIFYANKYGESILHAACSGGQIWLIKEIVKKSKKNPQKILQQENKKEQTPLMYAIEGNQLKTVKYLLSHKIDINKKIGRDKNTALHYAVKSKNPEIAQYLVLHGADTNQINSNGESALHSSVINRNYNQIEMLLKNGADPNIPIKPDPHFSRYARYNHCTPFHIALQQNNHKIMRLLLKYNIDLSKDITFKRFRKTYSIPLLVYAIQWGKNDTTSLLINHGIDVNRSAKEGYFAGKPPLLLALEQKNKQLAFQLLYHGADPDVVIDTAYNGKMKLIDYARKNGLLKTGSYYRQQHIILVDTGDKSALLQKKLLTAIKQQDLKKIKSLVHEGASPVFNYRDRHSDTDFFQKEINLFKQTDFTILLHYPIDFAVVTGNKELIDFFLKQHMNINKNFPHYAFRYAIAVKDNKCARSLYTSYKKKFPDTKPPSLVSTITYNNMEIADFLLQEGADPKQIFINGITLINIAMEHNNPAMAHRIRTLSMSNTANLNLFTAIYKKNSDQVLALLKAGADINSKDPGGITPLAWASYLGHNSLVEQLLKHSAKMDISHYAQHPLYCAALGDNAETVDLLVRNGADPNQVYDPWSFTPLHVAAQKGYMKTLKMLLQHKADMYAPELRIQEMNTPFQIAIKSGKTDIVAFLLKQGFDVNKSVSKHQLYTPLMTAVRYNKTDFVKLLLANGAKTEIKRYDGTTALHYAAQTGNKDIFVLILKNTPDIDIKTNNNETPLMFAVRERNNEIVDILLGNSADKSIRDTHGNTLLHTAVKHNNIYVTKKLLKEHAVDINAENRSTHTALYYAVKNSNLELCKMLINNGAECNLTYTQNRKKVSLSDLTNHYEIWKLLTDRQKEEVK